MLGQPNHTAKRDLRQFIDGRFAVVEFLVRHAVQENADELRHFFRLDTDGNWRDLLIVANDDGLPTEIQCKQ